MTLEDEARVIGDIAVDYVDFLGIAKAEPNVMYFARLSAANKLIDSISDFCARQSMFDLLKPHTKLRIVNDLTDMRQRFNLKRKDKAALQLALDLMSCAFEIKFKQALRSTAKFMDVTPAEGAGFLNMLTRDFGAAIQEHFREDSWMDLLDTFLENRKSADLESKQ